MKSNIQIDDIFLWENVIEEDDIVFKLNRDIPFKYSLEITPIIKELCQNDDIHAETNPAQVEAIINQLAFIIQDADKLAALIRLSKSLKKQP